MICPRCGSRDVLDSRDAKRKEISCECQRCNYEWTEWYDPWYVSPKKKVREVLNVR